MFYHVCFERENLKGDNEKIGEYDFRDLERIKEDFLTPYLKKEDFWFDGSCLSNPNISKIIIIRTDFSSKELEKRANGKIGDFIAFCPPLKVDKVFGCWNEDVIDNITNTLIKEVKNQIEEISVTNQEISKTFDNNKVFIVHGHDNEIKEKVARFIEQIGLKSIILHEQANKGMTIIEKLAQHTSVGFGIVLYTPCDKGAKEGSSNFKPRARQNVVFEHGYLLGKLGHDKVFSLKHESVETPNDISGVVYTLLDDLDSWKQNLIRELKNSGYKIDANKMYE